MDCPSAVNMDMPEPMKIHLDGYEEDDFNATWLARSHNAALAVENARLARDNTLMRLQSQGMASMPYAPPGLCDDIYCPWEMPRIGLHPQWCHDDINNAKGGGYAMPKMSNRQKGSKESVASVSTASGDYMDMSFQSSMSTASGEYMPYELEAETRGALQSTPLHLRTTVMLRNLPNNLDRDQLLQLVNDKGFEACYNLIYLPIDFKSKAGLGYAFIDFLHNEDAERFFTAFQGFTDWTMSSDKVCDVSWSAALQGIDGHVKRYRNSPVMHESVCDKFRPLLFKDGKRVPFPEPTKRIKAPRQWPRRHCQ